jgi:hypothetical protein
MISARQWVPMVQQFAIRHRPAFFAPGKRNTIFFSREQSCPGRQTSIDRDATFAASNPIAIKNEISDAMFTLCIRLVGAMLFWTALAQTAVADCAPGASSGQNSTGKCDVGNKPLSNSPAGTSFAPCGTNAPTESGVYGPSTGGVYEPSTGNGNGGIYPAPSGSPGDSGTLGCPNGASASAPHNRLINSQRKVIETSHQNMTRTQTRANNRPSNNSARFHGTRVNHLRT